MSRTLIPLGAFIALVVVLGIGLTLNPREVPSPLVGKPMPEFELPRLHFPEQTFERDALLGKVSLVNFWATWCSGCLVEHPLLVRIADQGAIPIYGINYKDDRDKAIQWLARRGDPYRASGSDTAGGVGIDLGVYGLPETFVVDAEGNVAYKHIGPLTEADWNERVLPVIQRLSKQP